MANIITGRESQSMRFKPHYNNAFGKYIWTKDDYLREMKRTGSEPYDPSSVTPWKMKEYKTSKWAHDMIKAAKRVTDKDGNVHLTGNMKAEFRKANMVMPQKMNIDPRMNIDKGGWV